MKIVNTDGKNKDFIFLCGKLDNCLNKLSGGNANRKEYEQYNLLDDIHDVFIVYSDNEPIGCAAFKQISKDTAEVKRVFVKEDFQGMGISKKMMIELESNAKEKGYKRLVLETGKRLESANGLYNSLGYKVIPNYGQYKDMPKSICFEKNL